MALVERFIERSEIDLAMQFFRDHWGKNHILGNDREFMLWQMSPERSPIFAGAGLAAVSYWDGPRLIGLIGVMSMPFNCNGDVHDSAWLCNLQAAPEYLAHGVGTRLMTSVHKLPIAGIGAVGINLRVIPMYRAMRYHCLDKVPRYIKIMDPAQAGSLVTGENAGAVLAASPPSPRRSATISVVETDSCRADWDEYWSRFTRAGYFGTERDAAFIRWRYLDHPRLDYRLSVARGSDGAICGAMIHRVEAIQDRRERVLRVVELIAHEEQPYDALLSHAELIGEDVAYIDHYTTQPFDNVFRSRGWYEQDSMPGVVTPSLFQPLVAQPRSINLAVRLLGETPWKNADWQRLLYAVKSDGDQDRPS